MILPQVGVNVAVSAPLPFASFTGDLNFYGKTHYMYSRDLILLALAELT